MGVALPDRFAGGSVADGVASDGAPVPGACVGGTPVPGPGVGEGRGVVEGLPIGGGVGGGVAAAATNRAVGTLEKKRAARLALTAKETKIGEDFTS